MDKEINKTFIRNNHDLEVTVYPSNESGEGYFTEEIAEMIGVLNKTNDNPNKKLIDAIVRFFDNDIKPTGGRLSSSSRESNGGFGYSQYLKPKYDDKAIEIIRDRITRKCRRSETIGTFKLCGVKFRLKHPTDWDIFN